jgi:hypothetical protein
MYLVGWVGQSVGRSLRPSVRLSVCQYDDVSFDAQPIT